MNIIFIGSGMMGRSIAHDLCKNSNFDNIIIADKDDETLRFSKKFLGENNLDFVVLNVENKNEVKRHFQNIDIAVYAIVYRFNYDFASIAIEKKTHFIDIGGNN